MNDNEKALDVLISETIKAVKKICKNLYYDKTYDGIISSINSDGYTVKYNGTDINIKTSGTDVFKKGDTVKFCIPSGNKRNAYFVVDLDLLIKIINQ